MVYKKKSNKFGRTIALIDATNIIYANKYLTWSIDHEKLIKYLKERYNTKKVIYYSGLEEGEVKRANFYRKIESFGFETRIRRVTVYKGKFYWKSFKCPKCGQRVKRKFQGPPIKKADCDVDLAVDAIIYSSDYDTLLLFSGDGDFSALVNYLKTKNKKTIIFSTIETCSRRLREMTYRFIEINQLRGILEWKK